MSVFFIYNKIIVSKCVAYLLRLFFYFNSDLTVSVFNVSGFQNEENGSENKDQASISSCTYIAIITDEFV